MTTFLKLQSITPPYTFISLGIQDNDTGEYTDSTLFTKGSVVELTSGKFPLTDYKDLYRESKLTHEIGGKSVRIIGFTSYCREGNLKEDVNCEIEVVPDQDGGKRRKHLTKKQRGKRSKRIGSKRRGSSRRR